MCSAIVMRGALLLNGNARTPGDLVSVAAPLLLSSRHVDPAVASARKVVLVTAGWENEHDEGAVKQRLNELGLPSRVEGGFDRAIENLSLGQELERVLADNPDFARAFAELEHTRERARSFYLAHNAHLVAVLRRAIHDAKELDPTESLARLADRELTPRGADAVSLHRFMLARELRHALDTLEGNDDRMAELSSQLDQIGLSGVGLTYTQGWHDARARLEARILGANAIVFFGGNLDRLLGALRFFRLAEVLEEALRRGTVIVGSSAGAMVLCDRVIVYDDFAHERREFQLWERGLGIVRALQLLPHCMERIQTDDPDNLAYLARRLRHRVCVGLNEGSFLLLDLANDTATSFGHEDRVYVFNPLGDKRAHARGEIIDLG